MGTYRDENLGRHGALGGRLPVLAESGHGEQLLKLHLPVLVLNPIPDNGVHKLIDEVHERLILALQKGNVPGPAARLDGHWLKRLELVLVRNVVDAHEVGAEVGDQEEGPAGVEDGLVRVRSLLTFVGAGLVEGDGDVLG